MDTFQTNRIAKEIQNGVIVWAKNKSENGNQVELSIFSLDISVCMLRSRRNVGFARTLASPLRMSIRAAAIITYLSKENRKRSHFLFYHLDPICQIGGCHRFVVQIVIVIFAQILHILGNWDYSHIVPKSKWYYVHKSFGHHQFVHIDCESFSTIYDGRCEYAVICIVRITLSRSLNMYRMCECFWMCEWVNSWLCVSGPSDTRARICMCECERAAYKLPYSSRIVVVIEQKLKEKMCCSLKN